MAGAVRRKRRKRIELEYKDAELNIMPFIDVFSVLNTFLLFSAVFVALGIIKVQIPFLTNKEDPNPPKRVLEVTVDATLQEVQIITRYTLAPFNENVQKFPNNDAGLEEVHNQLVQIRQNNEETDLVNLMTADEIKWERVIKIIDAIKMRKASDPVFESKEDSEEEEDELTVKTNTNFVFPKVVMGSVLVGGT